MLNSLEHFNRLKSYSELSEKKYHTDGGKQELVQAIMLELTS